LPYSKEGEKVIPRAKLIDVQTYNKHFGQDIEKGKIEINVFTGKECAFCVEAMQHVQDAVEKVDCYDKALEIVERSVDDDPELAKVLDILALPVVMVGRLRVIGIPQTEDVEELIHWAMLIERDDSAS
jgi:hypothetical protein